MNKIGKNRLTKLANHLLADELGYAGDKIFDYEVFNDAYNSKYDKKGCGTSGCALGECPIVFPKSWKFNRGNNNVGSSGMLPVLNNFCGVLNNSYCYESAAIFFDITLNQARYLFDPSSNNILIEMRVFGGIVRIAVANHILKFVEDN